MADTRPFTRRAWTAALWFGWALVHAVTAHGAELPAPFSAAYAMRVNGVPVGRMLRELRSDGGDRNVFRSETVTTGLAAMLGAPRIVEESRWRREGRNARPIAYRYEQTGRKKSRKVLIDFDWARNLATNSLNGQEWRMDLVPGVLDKLLYQIVLMRDLREGLKSMQYEIADGGRIKTFRFEVVGQERIGTALGEMDTLRITRVRNDDFRQTTLWCAPALGYAPVRVDAREKDGSLTNAEIESSAGLGPQ
ncbi:MAG: DUF3108 domain-containing protein [Gammaproteobacteria bacterium]